MKTEFDNTENEALNKTDVMPSGFTLKQENFDNTRKLFKNV